MPTRLHSVVFDAADPARLARFWSTATGWPIAHEDREVAVVEPASDASGRPVEVGLPLVFVPVADAKVGKNRVHLDLASRSAEHQAEVVARVRRAGATPLDIGQGEAPWVVLADPEGNELCILEPRAEYAGAGVVAAIVVDAHDPVALAPFWEAATGWAAEAPSAHGHMRLHPPGGTGPRLELLRNGAPKVAKNRVHLDVAPYDADDQAAEIERLRAAGAADVDIGQGDQARVVVADPEGNEVCVLGPPD